MSDLTREGDAATAFPYSRNPPLAATHPDSEGVRGLTIEEVKATVLGRIKTAFSPVGEHDDPETQRKAEWVVNGMEKWGVLEGQEEGVEPWQ